MPPTDELAARHELLAQIGSSERAAVFQARDLRRRQPVVIKRFIAARLPAGALARYAAVVAALRRANIPDVVLPLELVTTGPAPFAAFEPLAGESLEQFLARGGPRTWARASEVVARCAELAAAVHTATGHGHLALKPANIWLSPTGAVSLLDAGVAELGVTAVPPRDGVHVDYRAPEQVDGEQGDATADVFALGVLLYELTAGVHPFAGASAFQVARQLLLAGTPPLTGVVRGMPPGGAREVEKLLSRALARDPAGRHVDAQEFAKALQYARRTVGTPNIPPATVEPPVRAPARPVIEVEDPTTSLQLPRLSARKKPPTGDPTAPTSRPVPAAPTPAPADPAPPTSPPRPAATPTPQRPTSRPASRSEHILLPSLDDPTARTSRTANEPPADRTEILPTLPHPTVPQPILADETDRLPATSRHPRRADATSPAPPARRPADDTVVSRPPSARRVPVDDTDRLPATRAASARRPPVDDTDRLPATHALSARRTPVDDTERLPTQTQRPRAQRLAYADTERLPSLASRHADPGAGHRLDDFDEPPTEALRVLPSPRAADPDPPTATFARPRTPPPGAERTLVLPGASPGDAEDVPTGVLARIPPAGPNTEGTLLLPGDSTASSSLATAPRPDPKRTQRWLIAINIACLALIALGVLFGWIL